jgi:hypothetical protein
MSEAQDPRVSQLSNHPVRAMSWLEALTPGGSEFHNDPQHCYTHVRRRLDSKDATIKRQQRRIIGLETLLRMVEERVDGMLDTLEKEEGS